MSSQHRQRSIWGELLADEIVDGQYGDTDSR
jgi:hypothetical protein